MDLERILQSIVTVQSSIPKDGFTAQTLGTERAGSGIVIRESGIVLTIGYLITEAESVWLTGSDGRVTPGHALAYDQETGFGLVQALGSLELPALDLGRSSQVKLGDPVILAGGGHDQVVHTSIVGKQEFAGYWEYLLDEAIFTTPAHPSWGGAGLISENGKLLGVGSLLVQGVTSQGSLRDLNMSVPIDLLQPILDDLLTLGRANRPPRPWLGVYSTESQGQVIIASLSEPGPAADAGLHEGDIITGVGEAEIESLADFYRKVWDCGPAGTAIPIEILRDGRSARVRVRSADRGSYLKKPRLH